MKTPGNYCAAGVAFRTATQELGISFEEAADKIGVSRATLTKLTLGRQISAALLSKMSKALPAPQLKKVVLGHLIDEVRRAGLSPDDFEIAEKHPHAYLLERVSRLLLEDTDRAVDLVKIIDQWQRSKQQKAHNETPLVQRPSRALLD
jgi:transcriptional regulator with XRE-family HTH domain